MTPHCYINSDLSCTNCTMEKIIEELPPTKDDIKQTLNELLTVLRERMEIERRLAKEREIGDSKMMNLIQKIISSLN
jgi:hypothetical protein